MTPTQVYLEASRGLAEEEAYFSCLAILSQEQISNADVFKLCREYKSVFFPEGDSTQFAYAVEDFSPGDIIAARNLRVLMLTLMAACWKDFQ